VRRKIMSAGAVFQEVLRLLNRHHLPTVSQRDLLATLEASHLGTPSFLYTAGLEAGLPRQQALTRAAAIYFSLCAVSLSDDLTDGECTYLSDPWRTGPCTQILLQTLSFHTLMEAELPASALAAAMQDLITCGGAQHIEMSTRQWSAPVFREVAEGIAGRLWSAYLSILWCDTRLASRAATVGLNMGLPILVWDDIRSSDPRYTSLPEADKHQVVAWAVAATQALRKENLRCLDALLQTVDPVFKRAS
jgi:hypothetical protein